VPGAKHPLETVKELATKGTMRLSVTKAREPLVRHLGTTGAARAFAREVILTLTENDYAETVEQRFGLALDVYGMRVEQILWFIKIAIELDTDGEDFLLVLSFHPAEKAIRTKGGKLEP
jgi:hypothetical protein